MSKIYAVFIFLILELSIFAQKIEEIKDLGSYDKNFKKGDDLFDAGQFLPALNSFLFAYNYDSLNANINFKIGSLYLIHPTKKHLAETFLEKAVTNVSPKYKDYDASEKRAPVRAILDLGKAYHLDYKFTKAREYYEKFEKLIDPRDSFQLKILKEFELQTEYASKYYSNPQKVKISNMGEGINSEFPDYSPVISADESSIIFTHRGPMLKNDGTSADDGWVYENVVISQKLDNSFPGKWSKPELIPNINSGTTHEASVGISADGQTLIVYRDDNNDGNLYYSKWNGKNWGNLTLFGSDINSKSWEPSACISPDGNTLYFVSDRAGGFGGRDIYRSKKLPNGNWGLAVNMGSKINSPFDEESPFITADNSYLYFSTQGHNSMGGFDIVYSRVFEDGSVDSLVNLGYPVNTPDDDLYFVVSADSRRAYYASAHEGGVGEKDIYMLELELPYPRGLVVLRGKVKSERKCDPVPSDISIEITDINEGSLVGIYRPKLPSGEFLSILSAEKEYEIKYLRGDQELKKETIKSEAQLAYQLIEKEVELPTVDVGTDEKDIPNSMITLFASLKDETGKSGVANKEVKLISSDKVEKAKTNQKGIAIFKNLSANKKYSLVLEEGEQSALITDNFNTDCLYNNDTIKKSLILKPKELIVSNTNSTTDNKTISNDSNSGLNEYKFYFNYNRTNPKSNLTEYKEFISKAISLCENNKEIIIELESSASKVPTFRFRTNENLARVRLSDAKKLIEKELKSKGFTNYQFVKENSGVNGPEYNRDAYKNAGIYREYQFIKIKFSTN